MVGLITIQIEFITKPSIFWLGCGGWIDPIQFITKFSIFWLGCGGWIDNLSNFNRVHNQTLYFLVELW